jgi:hypothetical protein
MDEEYQTSNLYHNRILIFTTLKPHISAPISLLTQKLRLVRRLHPRSHILHKTVLHHPTPVLTHPDIVTLVVEPERLLNIVQRRGVPMRPSDATAHRQPPLHTSSRPERIRKRDLLSNHSRPLRSLHLQYIEIGDEMLHLHIFAVIRALDGCYNCLLPLRDPAIWRQGRTVVDRVIGEDLVEQRIILAVDGVGEAVAALRQAFDRRGEVTASGCCEGPWETG